MFPRIVLRHKYHNEMAGPEPPREAEERHCGVIMLHFLNVIYMILQVVRPMIYHSVVTKG